MKRIVTVGGGTGQTALLKALRRVPDLEITAVVPVTDSGGSTGRLRLEYGTSGSIGDLMRCVTALSPLSGFERALSRRFDVGSLHGHTVRNLLFAAAERESGLIAAAEEMCGLFQTEPHRVLPVSSQTATLVADAGGEVVEGEHEIGTLGTNPFWDPVRFPIQKVWLKEAVPLNPQVSAAVARAHWLVVAPGDLMTSVSAVLAVPGVREAVRDAGCGVLQVLNITTKYGETDGFSGTEFVEWVEQLLGRKVNVVLANRAELPGPILTRYRGEHKGALVFGGDDHRVHAADLWGENEFGAIVHDPHKLAAALSGLL